MRVDEVGEEGQKVQTSSYRIKWSLGCHVTIVNNTVLYISKLLRVDLKIPCHEKKNFVTVVTDVNLLW